MSTADDIKRLVASLSSAEMWDGYAEQQAAEVALHTAIDALQTERDALLETQRKFGALMHKTMEERDSLLEALKEFVYEYDSGTLTETQRIQKARLAIVKALASEGKVA
jgi:hypothetical protein